MATIDADCHVIETERTWEYMEGSDRRFMPRSVHSSDPSLADAEREHWLIDGRLHNRRGNIGKDTSEASREMADIDARLRHMDELEVDVQVLYPTVFLDPITDRVDADLAISRSYNCWLSDICSRSRGRLRWVAVLPLLTINKAIAELETARQHGACGVFMRYMEADRLLTDPYFYPLYEAAEAQNVPICIHASSGSFTTQGTFLRAGGLPLFKLGVIGAFHSLAISEVPDRFPGLKFAFIEVSSQWIPHVVHDLAARFAKGMNKQSADGLLARKRFYVACQTDDDLPYVLTYAGEDNLVIGSDYGHADTASEIAALRNLQENSAAGAQAINKILTDNPAQLYGIS
ncbi:MAG TPA: amidohydrolase family protein [Dehalococcoidia bacterium]|nr:amidohydrolase family protein [Dehalococcoidia bacterium]